MFTKHNSTKDLRRIRKSRGCSQSRAPAQFFLGQIGISHGVGCDIAGMAHAMSAHVVRERWRGEREKDIMDANFCKNIIS